ncbi:hypothetical protein rsdtw13_10990 [Clostridium sp. TW13]|uniref:Uncharacterized protein n=1 Tax=Inconstantimicrobium mannanitabidum TaxID=1604901 RepID=A0ACB5R9X2_9CLOT|nr:hypothetical protein rsdtw13_10990 [Clostridium sp. TW13]
MLIINSKLMTCIDGNGINKLNNMYGDFPIFEVGQNLISSEGSVSSIKVKYKNVYR